MGNGGAFPGKALEELTASELAEGAARLGPSYAAALRSISMSMMRQPVILMGRLWIVFL